MMKKINLFFLSILAFASCKNNIEPIENIYSAKSYPASISCNLSKVTLDATHINWNTGDKIYARAAAPGQTWSSADCDTFTAVGSGESAEFSGSIRYDYSSTNNNIFLYYSNAIGFSGTSSSGFIHTVPAEQRGTTPSDHMLLWSVIEKNSVSPVYDDNEEVIAFNITGNFSPFIPLIKFNLLNTLNVTEITVEGTDLSAKMKLNTNKTIGTSDYFSTNSSANAITVKNNGEILSGDIYIAVVPNAYDSDNTVYYNNSTSLKFTFKNSSGETAIVNNTLNKCIQAGAIKNLGNITTLDFVGGPKASGELTMMEDASALRLTVAGAPEDATLYYEIGDKGTVTPTITSASFSAAEGFVIPTEDNFTEKMVRVLIHPNDGEHSDAIVNGYIRNWKTVPGSGIYTAYTNYLSDNQISSIASTSDNNKITADGLTANKRSSSNAGYLNGNGLTDCLSNSNVTLIAKTQNDGADFEFRYNFHGGTSGKTLGINAGLDSDGYPTNWIESKNVVGSDTPVSFVYKWREDLADGKKAMYKNVKAGTPVSASGNLGSHYVHEISLLEKGDNVIVPEKKETVAPAFKLSEYSVSPLVVIDTAVVGAEKLAQGVKFYYTAGTEGFGALATPTTSGTMITKDGFGIAAQATKYDALYVKVLATGQGFEDSYIELYLRSWHFGWNYEPDAKPTSGTQYDFYTTDKCPYYGLTYSPELGTNSSWGNRAQFKNNCDVYVNAAYESKAQMHLAIFNASNGKQINWHFSGKWDSSTVTPDITYQNPVGISSPAKSVAANDKVEFKANGWNQIQSFSVMEQITWAPDFVTSGASVSDLSSGSSINIQ